MKEYVVITEKNMGNARTDDDLRLLDEEICRKLDVFGLSLASECMVHFFASKFYDERTDVMTLEEATGCLAMKAGANLVLFEGGNLGFVAYYNTHCNGFEIIG